jgi:DNA replication licensing factor MCM4
MSSPPPIDFPSDDIDADGDVDMDHANNGETQEQSMINAPPQQSLFLPGTPSTPASRRGGGGTPMGSAVARRALGMSTPKSKRTPLFLGGESAVVVFHLRGVHTL